MGEGVPRQAQEGVRSWPPSRQAPIWVFQVPKASINALCPTGERLKRAESARTGPAQEGPESGRKPAFQCEREIAFTALPRHSSPHPPMTGLKAED
jgi:hypothetical protein